MTNFEFEGTPTPPRRSTFVNVLAWIFIVLGSFATFISILQNIMVRVLFRKDEMTQVLQQAESSKQIPAAANFMFHHIDSFLLIFLVVSVTSVVSAIALLKRKNWARIVFIVLMSLGIAWNLGGLVLQFTLFNTIPQMAGMAVPAGFEAMMIIMKIANVLMVVAISILFGWIIKKLTSPLIKAEFCQ
ncbi:MAG: hypothetical protein WCA04_12420 [Geobacteraceae bacterium]